MRQQRATVPCQARSALRARVGALAALCAVAASAGCGGGSATPQSDAAATLASAYPIAQPTFHLAPVVLAPPTRADADGASGSSRLAPFTIALPGDLARIDTQRMTLSRIPPAQGQSGAGGNAGTPQEPAGGGTPLVVYSPAQIRAAYRQPPVTQAGTPLAAADAAALGAGQTIYLIGAHAGPNLLADLGQFDAAFGLPACSELPLPAATALPLPAAAAGAGCTLSVAYIDGTGARTDAVPAYDEAWAFELDMDVQWAHATAPLARLIVIAAPSGDVGQLAAAVQLANAMGPGVVSMSFGAIEGEYVRALEGAFEGHAAMSYVASAGDAGRGVAWPASSPTVLAVGGTTLHFTGDAPREESAWGDTGGGWSAYFDAPDWQASPAPPPPRNARHHTAKRHVMRSVADVAFNADPWSGQFILVSAPGAASPNWYSGGGTSIGAPQWAGLIAVSNAQRALAGKPPLGTVQARLYQGIAAVAGLYAGAFDDVQSGGDAQFAAHIGYDQPTGLGTPNTADLLAQLAAS